MPATSSRDVVAWTSVDSVTGDALIHLMHGGEGDETVHKFTNFIRRKARLFNFGEEKREGRVPTAQEVNDFIYSKTPNGIDPHPNLRIYKRMRVAKGAVPVEKFTMYTQYALFADSANCPAMDDYDAHEFMDQNPNVLILYEYDTPYFRAIKS